MFTFDFDRDRNLRESNEKQILLTSREVCRISGHEIIWGGRFFSLPSRQKKDFSPVLLFHVKKVSWEQASVHPFSISCYSALHKGSLKLENSVKWKINRREKPEVRAPKQNCPDSPSSRWLFSHFPRHPFHHSVRKRTLTRKFHSIHTTTPLITLAHLRHSIRLYLVEMLMSERRGQAYLTFHLSDEMFSSRVISRLPVNTLWRIPQPGARDILLFWNFPMPSKYRQVKPHL